MAKPLRSLQIEKLLGVSGNREVSADYIPKPYLERVNQSMEDVPSLYDYQLNQRLKSVSD